MKKNERRRRKRREKVESLINNWNKPFIGLVVGNGWLRSKKMDGQDRLSWEMGVVGNEWFSREEKPVSYND